VAFGDVLLGILAEGPAHGYDLKREHDARFPASRSVAYGQVYAALGRLEQQELVEVVETRQDGGPERTVYAITGAGETALGSWLETTEEPGSYAADELVRKTVTALLTGHDAGAFLARQREVHVSAMRRLTTDLRDAKTVGAEIAIDHARAHLDAELRWLDDARERVRRARTEVDAATKGDAS
jgi:DNA-binding PadR family transcriptional regulator